MVSSFDKDSWKIGRVFQIKGKMGKASCELKKPLESVANQN